MIEALVPGQTVSMVQPDNHRLIKKSILELTQSGATDPTARVADLAC